MISNPQLPQPGYHHPTPFLLHVTPDLEAVSVVPPRKVAGDVQFSSIQIHGVQHVLQVI
jgi:hypothetical protein